MSTDEEVVGQNRQYLEAAGDVLRRVRDTIGHAYKYGPATIGMKFTNSGTDLRNPPSQYLDGTELADDAFYRFCWGSRRCQLSAEAAAIFGATEARPFSSGTGSAPSTTATARSSCARPKAMSPSPSPGGSR
jgi:hypothetical protein